jgi:hypothetical protein
MGAMTGKDPAAVSLGRKGGKAGTGASKRRSAEHYRRMVDAREKKTSEKPPEQLTPQKESTP